MSTTKKPSSSALKPTAIASEWNTHMLNEIQRIVFKGVDSSGLYQSLNSLSDVLFNVCQKSIKQGTDAIFSNTDIKDFNNIIKHYKGNGTLFYVETDLRQLLTQVNVSNRPSKNEEHAIRIAKAGYKSVMHRIRNSLLSTNTEEKQKNSAEIYQTISDDLKLLANYIKLSSLVFEGKNRSVIKQLKTLSAEQVAIIPEKSQEHILLTFTSAPKIIGQNKEVILKLAA